MPESTYPAPAELPAAGLAAERTPGHWLLARLGKRVLRPGGAELTATMIDLADIGPDDDVVELAPGLGHTAARLLARHPHCYIGVDADEHAASIVRRVVAPRGGECRVGQAWATGLDHGAATVVVGEAMLTMQSDDHKSAIIREAHRVLRPGGRYAIHELALVPDDLPPAVAQDVYDGLRRSIKVGARPLTIAQWHRRLEAAGFTVVATTSAPMRLLEPRRLIADEGYAGAVLFLANLMRDRAARRLVAEMRRVLRRHREQLAAVAIVATVA